jgi:hypothetical protein
MRFCKTPITPVYPLETYPQEKEPRGQSGGLGSNLPKILPPVPKIFIDKKINLL